MLKPLRQPERLPRNLVGGQIHPLRTVGVKQRLNVTEHLRAISLPAMLRQNVELHDVPILRLDKAQMPRVIHLGIEEADQLLPVIAQHQVAVVIPLPVDHSSGIFLDLLRGNGRLIGAMRVKFREIQEHQPLKHLQMIRIVRLNLNVG